MSDAGDLGLQGDQEPSIDQLCAVLSSVRLPIAGMSEVDIENSLASALENAVIPHRRQAPIAPRCRVDLLVGRIVIEVKKGRPALRSTESQIERYTSVEGVSGLILVLERALPLPSAMNGSPVRVVSLNANWGIAL